MIVKQLCAAAAGIALLAGGADAEAPMRGGQAPGWYRMTLGKFEITALSDGTIQAPVDRFLHGVPPAREKALLERAYLESPVETSVNGFLVNTGRKLMLIDAGAGGLYGPVLGKLVANLEASGYAPEQVDEIYMTHLHGDHVGGITRADGVAVFPNAVVRVDAKDADHWLSHKNLDAASADEKASFKSAMGSVKPYADTGRFKPFSGATERAPGIHAIPAHGHTPGHTVYAIESEGRKLVVWGDMVHVAAVQFPHPTATWSESDSRLALAQRRKHFADASKKGYYVALAHVAFPGIGRLRAEGSGYVWVPVVYSTSVAAPGPAASIVGSGMFASDSGQTIRADYRDDGTVTLLFADGITKVLSQAVSGSGARYVSGSYEWWEHQGEATYSVGGKRVFLGKRDPSH